MKYDHLESEVELDVNGQTDRQTDRPGTPQLEGYIVSLKASGLRQQIFICSE